MFKKRTASFLIMLLMLSILLLTVFTCTMPTASSGSSSENKDNKTNEVLLSEDDQSRAVVTTSKIDAFTIYNLDVNQNFSYIAPYKSDEVIIFQMQTANDEDVADIRCKIENNKYYVKIQEEKSKDIEVSHDYETVKAITVKKGSITLGNGNTGAGEAGSLSIRRDSSHEWYTVNLSRTYTSDIVVFANVVTYNSAQECHVRIKDVTRSSFKIKLEEWAYRDGVHTNETVHYMVLKNGTFNIGKANPDLAFDYTLSVGKQSSTDRYWRNCTIYTYPYFTGTWKNSVLMSTLQTYDDSTPVIVRTCPVIYPTHGDFCKHKMFEEQAGNQNHDDETVGFFILGPKNGPKSTIVDTCGKLKVSQSTGRLLSESGSVKRLKGMSLFWINWPEGKKFANASVVNWLVDDWKIQILRIPVGGDPYNQYGERIDNSGYKYNAAELDAIIEEVIETCIYKGIYVILDWHEHDAIQTKSLAKEFFKKYAKKYKNYDNVLFEVWNEPSIDQNHFMNRNALYYDTRDDDNYVSPFILYNWSDDVKPYNEELVNVIRGEGNTNIIICGTPYFSSHITEPYHDKIDDDNVMYSFHFYAKSHNKDMSTSHVSDFKYACKNSLPVFVTEWGTTYEDGGQPNEAPYYSKYAEKYGGTGMEIDEAQSKAWMSLLKENYISWCNWSVTDKKEGSAILRYNKNVSDIGGWLTSDLTESGTLIRSMIRSTSY